MTSVALNVENWRAILHLVLDNDTDRLKANFVLIKTMAEPLIQTSKKLESSSMSHGGLVRDS